MWERRMAVSYSGGCVCGMIRFEAQGVPRNPHFCSCITCRRHSGALMLPWVEFDRSAVEWTGIGGMPQQWRSSDGSSRIFCGECGASLGAVDDAPVIALLVGSFDDPRDAVFQPVTHAYADRLPAWSAHILNRD